MDAARWTRLNDLLAGALALPAEDRAAHLAAHAPDEGLRAEAEALLLAHEAADAADALATPFGEVPLPGPIGPWRPTGRLGAGGMGVVYAAERADESFRQRAALKLIRPGFGADFRERFLRERAVLAGLDHPGVARLLDGGLTADGLPYLAMELVEGEPITDYAAARGLPLRERLRLFLQACDAVAHAHRHLVVHRDLKPAHILVADDPGGTAEGRGGPRVKLLDFGVAKLLDAEADDGLTRTGAGPLTPQYAAPEQLAGRVVTTAADVYSLGVVLYELLTGNRPYDVKGLPPSEAERVVAATVPPRPSATEGGSTDTRRLRGDLDTVVLKALAKEPDRRYPSAEALADDIERYLDGLPVRARPDTWGYRARKFVRRHRASVGAGAVALAAVLGGAGAALWQAREARAEAAKAEAVQDFLLGMLAAADPDVDGRDVRVADLLDRAAADLDSSLADQPEVRADAHYRLGLTYQDLGLLPEAVGQFRRSLALRERLYGARAEPTALAQRDLGMTLQFLGDYDAADSLYARALTTARALHGENHVLTSTVLAQIATLRYDLGDYAAAADAHRRVLAIEEAILPPDDIEVVFSMGNLGVALADLGETAEATALFERQVGVLRTAHGNDKAALGNALANLGSVYVDEDRLDDAARVQTEAVALFRDALGDDHGDTAFGLSNLGSTLTLLGRPAEAEPLLRESAAIYRSALGATHPNVGFPLLNLAKALRDLGRLNEAEAAAREAERLFGDGFGADHPAVGRARETLTSIEDRQR